MVCISPSIPCFPFVDMISALMIQDVGTQPASRLKSLPSYDYSDSETDSDSDSSDEVDIRKL